MRQKRQWALVLNATQARILRNVQRNGTTSEDELTLVADVRDPDDTHSDRPGRSFSSGGGGRRSAMEPHSDMKHHDAQAFAMQVIAALEPHSRADHFDHLAIFADPDMLGIIRKQLPATLRSRVNAEIDKNLLHETATDLPRVVAAALGLSKQ